MATTADELAAVRSGGGPPLVERLLRAPGVGALARVLLTAAFWTSGVAKLLDFPGAVAEVAGLGLPAPALVAALTILVQLGGSALVVLDRWAWLGAGALAAFTVAATVLAHAFWNAPADQWAHQFATFTEHMGLVGGFLLAAILSARRGRP